MEQIQTILGERAPVVVAVAVMLACFLAVSTLASAVTGKRASKLPLIGEELGDAESRRKAFNSNAKSLYEKGYQLFKNAPFRMTDDSSEKVILPRHLLDEVRKLSDDTIDITKALEKMNETKYSKLGSQPELGPFLVHVIRSDLNRGLNRINPLLTKEVERTVNEVLPGCDDWTEINLYSKILPIVAIVSGSIFLGPELARNETYVHSSIHYTVDLFTAIPKLKLWNPWLRPIGQYYVKEFKSVAEHRRKAQEFLRPVIAERRKLEKEGAKLPDDMLQWMLNKSKEFGLSDDSMSTLQLNLSLAAIHTTSLTTVFLIYDLLMRPDLVQELRQEIKTVLDANGGVMTTHALFEMKLLDSVMKESQRYNPGNQVRFARHVNKDVTLSDGTHLAAGTWIEANHGSIVSDPSLYTHPETFDGHRFMNLRNSTAPDPLNYSNKEQYQFVTTTKDFMHFGYGRHACPGRFFAANEIKLIVARLLLDFDIRMPDGITEAYKPVGTGLDALPDPSKSIMLKRVAKA